MNRPYAIEPTVTGPVGDHRWPLDSAQAAVVTVQLAHAGRGQRTEWMPRPRQHFQR
ncbi:hypothetical protein ACO2Q2_16305 [Dyella sp. KRB-257]|uniref:hypothetical protein n=1 Tax=Dyella sp. KRB-257 TaxID=3400915 RepID=UPI003C02FD41